MFYFKVNYRQKSLLQIKKNIFKNGLEEISIHSEENIYFLEETDLKIEISTKL